jgi:exosortase/archaeosortase family protein
MAKWQALQEGIRGTRLVRWWNARPPAIRFAVRAAALMAIFYSALYYPYGESSLPAHLLSDYLALVARVSGGCLRLFDPNVHVEGTYITGRNALQIVLDCAALDALALFGATLLAFPASIRLKVIGFAAGILVISGFNLLRIIILYVAAVKSPDMFEFLHEDVMALMMVFVSVACFAVWAALARNRSAPRAIHASTLV